jgi:hypothetical protein
MATYTRANAWNNGGTFDNADLLWYAKGVGAMQARALNDSSSWWFFAAIHGEYVTGPEFPGWGFIPSPPNAPTILERVGTVLGSVSAPKLVFPPLASRISVGIGGADPSRCDPTRWSLYLGAALLGLFRAGLGVCYSSRLHTAEFT